ncbi:MAG: hypothetical protein QW272_08465 [Candidatus Methanomethylicaceae archaeon]
MAINGAKIKVGMYQLKIKIGIANLSIDGLYHFLTNNGFNIKANLSITFRDCLKIIVSILKSGIMIVEGADNEKEAYDFYSKIIIEKLKIPRSNIE